jgi:hypothetical protein
VKKLTNCIVENCVPTPSSCIDWNCGDIKSLGICNGDPLCNVIWEIVYKLEEIAGEDIASFDIDELLNICNQKAPLEITLISILTLLKNNDICLKDYIDTLNDKINELSSIQGVKVNLKCYNELDNLGNSLSITREQLDQLVIDKLCNHKQRIESIEGDIITIKQDIIDLEINPVINELEFPIVCAATPSLSHPTAPTSSQVLNIAADLCALESQTGIPSDISSALGNTPDYSTLAPDIIVLPAYWASPNSWAQNYSNLLLALENALDRLSTIEETCCSIDCTDVMVGFTASFNEDNDGVIIKFTSGAGTNIPGGFLDLGSTITITDEDGNVETFITSDPDLIANNAIIEIPVSTLITVGDVNINVDTNIGNGSLTCSKCLNKTIKRAACSFCVLTATDTVTITYKICPTVGV